MSWSPKKSLRGKIVLSIMATAISALALAGVGFAEYGLYRYRQLNMQHLDALAHILATNSTAPLEFDDPDAGRDILRALDGMPRIMEACVYDAKGKLFSAYRRENVRDKACPASFSNQVTEF